MIELELTFLPKELPPNLASFPSKEMLDIYIPSNEVHSTLRIRKNGTRTEITKKQPIDPSDASRQLETTIPLTPAEYAELSNIPGKRVGKTRYAYEEHGYSFEIDVFLGTLKGLVLVDIEFETEEEKAAFVMPSWCLVDVTQSDFIAGGLLCGKSYEDIQEKLSKLGYEKIKF